MNEQPVWQATAVCTYCEHRFDVSADTVQYDDLKPPRFFEPDWQYFVPCPNCSENYILSEIPSHVAVWIQTRLYTPK